MARDNFVFYRSFADGLKELSDSDRLACYDAIVSYALDGISEAEGVAAAVLALVRPIIDANRRKAEAGRKGGEANKKQIEAEPKQSEATQSNAEANESKAKLKSKEERVNSKEEIKKEEIKKEARARTRDAFVKPSLDEIKVYCSSRQNGVDPAAFYDFYESKGWKVGSQSMKDWKAAVRTWERRETSKKKTTGFDYADQRHYTEDEYKRIRLAAMRRS